MRHNGVQFFISLLASWLRTRRFSEPTFRPSGATNHWKNTVNRDFPTFSRICIFFLLTLSLLWSSLFYSSLLSDSSHLCFSSVHIVGSLTSKLPLWREGHVEVKMSKKYHMFGALLEVAMFKSARLCGTKRVSKSKFTKPHVRTTFGSCDVEKVHAVVPQSTCRSQNVQNTTCSDHKTHQLRTTFGSWDTEKVHAVVARSIFPSQNVKNTRGSDHFWTFRCRFAWQEHGIAHLLESERNARVLSHFQKRRQAWGIWRGSAKMHFPWQAQYKRHLHQSC